MNRAVGLFSHLYLITALVTRVARRVSHVEQELLTIPEHLSSPSVSSGVNFILLNLNFLCNVTYKCRSLFVVLFFSVGYCIVCLSNLQLLNLQAFLGNTLKLLSCSMTYCILACRSQSNNLSLFEMGHMRVYLHH